MKQFTISLMIVHVMLMDYTDSRYPDCVTCTDGSMPLSPLSYNTTSSNVFNGIQPSNDSSILIDCNGGLTSDDYSDLSHTFAWNRTTSVAQQVSIVFRFDQQINISRIAMYFWNSPSNSIIVPNVSLALADHNVQFTDTAITANSPNRTEDGQSILNIDISDDKLKFVYLRITMTFYSNSEWIFLGEVQFCGNTAPYHITQPLTDNDVQIVSPTATMTSITCSLNITIPSTVIVTWVHNNSNAVVGTKNGDTTTLQIENFQPSDAGVYQCVFSDVLGSGWEVRRSLRLVIADITTTTPGAMATTSTATSTAIASTSTTTSTTTTATSIPTTTATSIPTTTSVTTSDTTSIPSVTSTAAPSTTIITTSATDSSTVSSTDTSIATIDTSTSIASVSTSSASSSIISISATTTTTTPAVSGTAAGTTTTTVISSTTHTTTTVATTAVFVPTTTITTTIADTSSTVAPDDNTSTAFTATTTTPDITTSSSSIVSSNAGGTSDSSDSNIVVTVVVTVIVIILLIAIIVTTVIMIYYWRKKKSSYHVYGNGAEPNEEPPLTPPYATVDIEERKSSHYVTSTVHNSEYGNHNVAYNQNPPLKYAVPNKKEKKEKRKSADPQRRMSIEFNYRPDRSPDIMSIRSPEPTLSVINPDYEETTFDIFSSVPDIPERTEASHGMVFDDKEEENPIYNRSENPIYSEAINPAAIVTDLSADYCTVDDKVSPYASIYTDPLPLVKSEGPPIVSNKNVNPLHKLGVGLFGEVVLANTVGLSYRDLGIGNSNNTNVSIKVAVKMLKASPSEEVRKSFEKEIKFMSRLKDDNVIRLLGICTTGTPFIMMEYMENGDLNNYLQKFKFTHETGRLPAKNEINLIALVYMSFQIASGMKYLSLRNFVHRDLAARNVLVGVDYTVKIADFGMSQNLYSEYYCRVGGQKVLPIRWMACECFFGKFSVKTDVWAFGITLWEIFTLCRCLPYDDLTNHQLIEDAVKGDDRSILERPKICPDEIYRIMRSCWHHESSERAKFAVLCDQLNQYYYSLA